jgi:hypothetical protein
MCDEQRDSPHDEALNVDLTHAARSKDELLEFTKVKNINVMPGG